MLVYTVTNFDSPFSAAKHMKVFMQYKLYLSDASELHLSGAVASWEIKLH